MAQDKRICRVCLEILGRDMSCFEFIKDDAVIQRLNLISFNTVKNLDLTDDPVICASCDGALKELAKFKERVIANEFKIQCNQKDDSNMLLNGLSKDIQEICRLCLKVTDSCLEENWSHHKKLLTRCNIHMNESIIQPTKICNLCFAALKSMGEFMSLCARNERFIADIGAAKGKLTLEDLFFISLNKGKDNLVSRRETKKEQTSIIKKDSLDAQREKISNKRVEVADSVKSEEESFNIIKTPNTYRNKTRATTLVACPETPSTSQARRSINQLINRKYILKKMNEQLRHMHTSVIDASPLTDLTDITLDVDKHNFTHQEAPSEYDVTQQLIDVLEGRLNDKGANYTTQELLNVLEDRLEGDEASRETADIDLEPEAMKEKGRKCQMMMSDVEVSPASDKHTEIVIGPKKRGPKKRTVAEPMAGPVRKRGRPKIIREVFNNLKPQGSSSTETESPVSKNLDNNDVENTNVVNNANMESTDIGLDIVQAVTKTNPGGKKRINKSSDERDQTSPPKKRIKRVPKKTEHSEGTISVTNDGPAIKQENESKILDNRPVVVTIVKSKKRTNRAQLDKTWQELTGSSGAGNNSSGADFPEGLEIELVRNKRGRPRKSPNQPKKPKKVVEWTYCQVCPFKTYTQKSFVQHQLIHNVMSALPMLNCDLCRYTTTNPDFLQVHKTRDHVANNDLSYKCVFCDGVFKKKISCMYHSLRHDDRDVASQFYCMVYNGATLEECFECFQCNYQNVDENPMPDHVIDHTIEKVRVPILSMIKCDICPYRTKSEELFKRHRFLRHSNQKKDDHKLAVKIEPLEENPSEAGATKEPVTEENPILRCDMCHYVTRQRRSLSNHKGLKHNRLLHPCAKTEPVPMIPEEERQTFYCNECSYSTHRKMNMPRHALVHRTKANMEFLECPHCVFETKHRRSYTRHMEVVHGVIV